MLQCPCTDTEERKKHMCKFVQFAQPNRPVLPSIRDHDVAVNGTRTHVLVSDASDCCSLLFLFLGLPFAVVCVKSVLIDILDDGCRN